MWPLSKCRFLVSIWLTSYKQQGAQVKLKKRKREIKEKHYERKDWWCSRIIDMALNLGVMTCIKRNRN